MDIYFSKLNESNTASENAATDFCEYGSEAFSTILYLTTSISWTLTIRIMSRTS
jgi:hypothetical protein